MPISMRNINNDVKEINAVKEPCLIQPFKSKVSRKPIASGARVIKGEWTKPLDDMGYKSWLDEEILNGDSSEERRDSFLNHLRWDIAHRNYNALMSCISISEKYNEETQLLDYAIDVYGDGNVEKHGQLRINRGDYLLYYMRMSKYRRKEALLSRIAISNVGMLVPYVQLGDITYNESHTHVQVTYQIVL